MRTPLDPSKLSNLIMFGCGTLGNILTSIVSNSLFGKRPGARDMTMFRCHVGPHVNDKLTFFKYLFQNSAAKPSQGLIFGLLLLPCGWEIRFFLYHLRRIEFLRRGPLIDFWLFLISAYWLLSFFLLFLLIDFLLTSYWLLISSYFLLLTAYGPLISIYVLLLTSYWRLISSFEPLIDLLWTSYWPLIDILLTLLTSYWPLLDLLFTSYSPLFDFFLTSYWLLISPYW